MTRAALRTLSLAGAPTSVNHELQLSLKTVRWAPSASRPLENHLGLTDGQHY